MAAFKDKIHALFVSLFLIDHHTEQGLLCFGVQPG